MTKQKSFKERIRARMDKTGETYATARRRLIEKSEADTRRRRTPQTVARTRSSEEAVRANTGRTWDEWLALLDAWGATDKKHAEIARWLAEEQEIDGWWAQHVTVAYEQERGMRAPGQRADGTYSVTASKTIAVPIEVLFEAFRDERIRDRWLGGFELEVRTHRSPKSMTAVWQDGSTRLSMGFDATPSGKSRVALAHEKVSDARRADELKVFWRARLNLLKDLLEE